MLLSGVAKQKTESHNITVNCASSRLSMANVSLDEEFRQLADDFQKRAKLTPQQLNAFKLTKVEDIRRVLVDVQKKHEKDRALIWLKRIDPFINTFLEFGNIVEVFLNTSEFLAFVWVCAQNFPATSRVNSSSLMLGTGTSQMATLGTLSDCCRWLLY